MTSVDVDRASVAATRSLWEQAGRPPTWTIAPGSILDDVFLGDLGQFDDVVSWGVLHHTGDFWHAIDNAARLVQPGGRMWIALYTRTDRSGRSLRTKRLYNRSPGLVKKAWRGGYGVEKLGKAALRGNLQSIRRYHEQRGMDWWRDIEDWLGGLPYEPVRPGEVLARLRPYGFVLERLDDALGEGANDVYLFGRRCSQVAGPARTYVARSDGTPEVG